MLDGGVVVFSAREGVEAQSETVWRQANKYHVPRLAFINKMDREGADFEAVFEEIGNRLGANPVALQIPVGQGPAHTANPFRGIIDLVKMKLLTFPEGKDGNKVVASEITDEDLADEAQLWRERLLESLYNYSNELMELALAEEPIPEALIHKVLREATLHLQIQPVLCGSALHGIGVQPILDAVAAYLPNPPDVPPVEGTDLSQKHKGKGKAAEAAAGEQAKKIRRKPDPAEPFCGLVFKIQPYKTGDLAWVRIYSGTLEAQPPRAQSTRRQEGKRRPAVANSRLARKTSSSNRPGPATSSASSACAIRSPATRCATRASRSCWRRSSFPRRSSRWRSSRRAPRTARSWPKRWRCSASRIPRSAPKRIAETGQTLISGMGELHLEVIQHRLLRDFHLNVKVHKPRVSYRETVARPAEVDRRMQPHDPRHASRGEGADSRRAVRKGHRSRSRSPTRCNHGLPSEMLSVVLEELESAGQGGGLFGFPLMRLKATVLGGEVGETGISEIAFRTAANHAFDQALRAAGPVLLEPIMKLEISTPDEHVGDLVSDLQQRRAIIQSTESRGTATVLHAEAPLANLFGYSSAMRSLSQGRASCSMEPSTYAPAPDEVLQKFLGES